MGYTTDFKGRFNLDKPLAPEHAAYLKHFGNTRRMKRADYDANNLPDPHRVAVDLPLGGPDAPYFVGGTGLAGQNRDKSIRDYNAPPDGQPGLWCQWAPTEDATGIEWDGGEKFYAYDDWLQYLVDHFLTPWGYTLTGSVSYQGERSDDCGVIVVEGGKVEKRGVDDEGADWDEDVGDDEREWLAEQLGSLASGAESVARRNAVYAAMAALGMGEEDENA